MLIEIPNIMLVGSMKTKLCVTKVKKSIKLIPTIFFYFKKLSFSKEEYQNNYDYEHFANINNSTF